MFNPVGFYLNWVSIEGKSHLYICSKIQKASQAIYPFTQYITTKKQHKYLITAAVSAKNLSVFLKDSQVASFLPNWDSEKSFICLHNVPLFLFLSCDWWETKLQRSEEALTATSPSPSMKKGSGRSVNMIKKTGNLLAMKNIALPFTRALMCPVSHPGERRALVAMRTFDALDSCLLCICLLVREALHFQLA